MTHNNVQEIQINSQAIDGKKKKPNRKEFFMPVYIYKKYKNEDSNLLSTCLQECRALGKVNEDLKGQCDDKRYSVSPSQWLIEM